MSQTRRAPVLVDPSVAPINPVGAWTAFATLLLAGIVGAAGGGFGPLIQSAARFLAGEGAAIERSVASPYELIVVTAAFLVLAVPLAFLAGAIAHQRLGEAEHALSKLISGLREKSYFRAIFVVVLAEELFARFLFLGVLGSIWTGTAALYTLFFLGNGLWALIHLYNYPDKSRRHPLRVLPQFVTGVLFSVVFLRYGFMAVLLAHFAFNAVVFAFNKRQRWGKASVLTGAYNLVVILVSLYLMATVTGTDPSAASSWLTSTPRFDVPGWNLLDYLLLATLLSAVIGLVLELLAYDQDNVEFSRESVEGGLMARLIGSVILVAFALGAYHALGAVMQDVSHRVIVVAILIAMVSKGVSGSAMSRSFWEGVPLLYVGLCAIIGLGLWGGIIFVLARSLLAAPVLFLAGNLSESYAPVRRSEIPAFRARQGLPERAARR